MKNKSVKIIYKNFRGEVTTREIIPDHIRFEGTQWHKEPQWTLHAFDIEKKAIRYFAIKDIQEWLTDSTDKK
ncbi:MAG: hypothetical protein Q7S53_04875 [bacterium]|nr:hypothetical protein [bacterium]